MWSATQGELSQGILSMIALQCCLSVLRNWPDLFNLPEIVKNPRGNTNLAVALDIGSGSEHKISSYQQSRKIPTPTPPVLLAFE